MSDKLEILSKKYNTELSITQINRLQNYQEILVVYINGLCDVCNGSNLNCSFIDKNFAIHGYEVGLFVTYSQFRENILILL